MQITVHGKQMDVGDALREYVTDKIEEIDEKYFNHATDAVVTFSKEGHGRGLTKTHISIHVSKHISVQSETQDADPYAAFDKAAEKVAKQLRRYKKRLRDHHERLEGVPETEITAARDIVLAAETDDEESEDKDYSEPLVVAEMATNIQTMTVSEAVMRLDLSGQPAIMFRNANHAGLNMVYRREDGNVGWVDPEGVEKQTSDIRKSA